MIAQDQSFAKLESLRKVPMQYKRLYGQELDFYDMLELADHVIKQAGQVAPKYYLLKTCIKNFEIELPCNVHAIEYVTNNIPPSLWESNIIPSTSERILFNYRVDESGNYGLYNPDATHYDELGPYQDPVVYEVNKNVFDYPSGNFIHYQNDNNCCLSFNFKEGDIVVLYRGPKVDEEGFPLVSPKTIMAITRWCILNDVKKKYFMKQMDGNQLAVAEKDYTSAIRQARVPESLGQNEANMILDSVYTWNRKIYNGQYRGQ